MDGKCKCGCGQATAIATRNRYDLGHAKGQPLPYVNGHNRRGVRAPERWKAEDRGHVTACWIWQGHVERNGYGKASHPSNTGRRTWAHRAIYEEFVGPIPAHLELDHLCRVTACVNPDHLEPVPHAENIRRAFAARGKT